VNLFARGADWKLLGVSSRHPDLPAERLHWIATEGRFQNLLFSHVMGEALVVAIPMGELRDLLEEGAFITLKPSHV